ncbi:E3 ubiquitin-protein ligase RNF169 [Oenanthe melanoleuca]|uniref:E3 ubiquitin-protein ligase RNF169 n=1 Tax=Oenanthe melanoleuca TaxID=2939378 RepID=UPI0024C1D44E|nr:E3 ubiquitin-protein ligase RNF169 [Oenanthe melanoleuca]
MAAAAAGAGGRAAVRGRRRRGRSAAEEQQDAVVLSAAECPVCRQAPAEAGTPACRHSLCLSCFQRCPQGPGLCCPLCRSRLSTRARRQQPEPAATTAAGAAAGEQRPPDQDFIFRAPIKLSKTGELREEYENQLRKLREEKLQDEKTSEDLIHKFIPDDMDIGKRKMEEQQKKDESVVLKGNQDSFPERLSDSENEEPFQGKQTHRSAFVSKTSAYSFAFLSGNLTSKVERSRSCNDTVQERSKSRQRSAPATKTKVLPVAGAAPLLGVLAASQNHRCLSAPELTAERRLLLGAVSSLSALHRPERSISPESNDSISEELNHFKPIVCSPCTPPKRLPDGRVLSPLIIKSTPRNLNRSLQKPTTYEASPRILKKWEQIFQERQIKKTLSKATLTSLASESGEDIVVPDITNSSSCTKEQPQVQGDPLPPDTAGQPCPELDLLPSVSEMKLGRGTEKSRGSQALTADDAAAEPDVRSNVTSLNTRVAEAPDLKVNTFMDKSCLSLGPKVLGRRLTGIGASLPDNTTLGVPIKASGKKQLKYLNNSELINVQNSTCSSVENIIGEQPPLLRRGRKRHCKTKHLEHNGSVKRLRHAAAEAGLPPEPRDVEQKLQQEEEDRRLALHLQRIFDSENRTVDRRRVRVDRYLLRSKSTLGAK